MKIEITKTEFEHLLYDLVYPNGKDDVIEEILCKMHDKLCYIENLVRGTRDYREEDYDDYCPNYHEFDHYDNDSSVLNLSIEDYGDLPFLKCEGAE